MNKQYPMMISANGTTYECSVWAKVAGRERVYIKTASGKDCLYYDIASDSFVNQRTWGAIGQQQRVENAFRAAIVEVEEVQEVEPAVQVEKKATYSDRRANEVRNDYADMADYDDEYIRGSYLYTHDL